MAALALAAAGTALAPAGAGAAFKPCQKRSKILCDTARVRLDRAGAVPGSVKLAVAKVPARATPVRGTVMFVTGGPGQSAIEGLPSLARVLGSRLPGYDFVAFDQRGTGTSGPLRCKALSGRGSETGVFAACGRALGPRRQFYRTQDSVDDLESVRLAVGGPSLTLLGVSYGTRVIGEYARRYPAGVARLVLDSPTPLAGPDVFDRPSQAALPRVMRSVCAGGACRSFTRSAYADLAAVAARLDRTGLSGRIIDERGGRHRVTLSLRGLHAAVTGSDLDPFGRGELPGALAAARRGDAAPLLRTASHLVAAEGSAAGPETSSDALYAATICAESGLPWNPASRPGAGRRRILDRTLRGLGARPFAPWEPRTVVGAGVLPVCLGWPAVRGAPALSGTAPAPTLVLSGAEDLRTPAESARLVLAGYPAGRFLAIPYTGHSTLGSDFSSCTVAATARFIATDTAPVRCAARRRDPEVAPRPPRSLGAIRARTVRRRSVAVVGLTIRDALRQIEAAPTLRVGGLRGGSLRLGRQGLILTRYSYVPCTSLNGALTVRRGTVTGRLRLRVACRGAAPAEARLLAGGEVVYRFGPGNGARRGAAASSVVAVAGPPVRVPPRRRAPALVRP